MNFSTPSVPLHTPCKCCGAASDIYGVVDFNKNCETGQNRAPVTWAGMAIYYHRCPSCSLIFTVAFDEFTKDDFAKYIYNDGYALVDPEYQTTRPTDLANLIGQYFGGTRLLSMLDYGGGNGKLTDLLRKEGFVNALTYDPFVAASAILPSQKFQLITCFEVAEHSPTPMQTFGEIFSLLRDDGIVVFSTLTQPPGIDAIGLSWWYVAPRNGHVSIYSIPSLECISRHFGMKLMSAGGGLHLMFRTIPDFARHLIAPTP